jgi:hypothetical protein
MYSRTTAGRKPARGAQPPTAPATRLWADPYMWGGGKREADKPHRTGPTGLGGTPSILGCVYLG